MDSVDPDYFRRGYRLICGLDEAGRGPLAGPVYCAAVILPQDHGIIGLDDSKKLRPAERERLAPLIRERAIAFAVASISERRIDSLNILNATKVGMGAAVKALGVSPDLLLIDALNLNIPEIPQVQLIKGDARSECIAAASILAKVARDAHMVKIHARYPQYNFARHKGYGTTGHLISLRQYGPCPIHRESFLKNISL